MNYSLVFTRHVNKPFHIIPKSRIGSCEPIVDIGIEVLSRLYFDDRKAFLSLKNETFEGVKAGEFKGFEVFIVLAYISYIEADFKAAVISFKKALKYEPNDQGAWLYLAFCYRQLGQDQLFERILLRFFY